MHGRDFLVAGLCCLAGAGLTADTAAQARADSAAFIVRLGVDTTAVERYVRTADSLVVEAVQRSPSTVLHRLALRLDAQGRVVGGEQTATMPGERTPVLHRTIEVRRDTVILTTHSGTNTRTQRIAAREPIPLTGPFYAPYELAFARALASGAARSVALLTGSDAVTVPIERVGRDSVRLQNQFEQPLRAHVDAQGRLLHLAAPGATTVERLPWLDLDALAREFAHRDETGRGLGPLSPRQTTRTSIGRANLWLDYSRPAMRGRTVWGDLVPHGEVWRLGANDATHFSTDRPLQLGSVALEPGTYTLALLPTADEWLLVVNRATGVWGLTYDAAQDVARIAMTRETLPEPVERLTLAIEPTGTEGEARLVVAWERMRGVVPIRVR